MTVQKYRFLMKYKSMINTSNSRVNWAAGMLCLNTEKIIALPLDFVCPNTSKAFLSKNT